MHGPRDCHTEWSKSEREREISYNIACMWNLMVQMNFLESKNNENMDNKFMITKGERVSGINWEICIDIYTLLCIK